MGTSAEREINQRVSRAELLMKIEQLRRPCSLAARAIAGLGLFLQGASNDQVLGMIAEGREFLSIFMSDWERAERFRSSSSSETSGLLVGEGDRYYQPSEVIPKDVENMEQKTLNIKRVLDKLANLPKGERVEDKDIIDALNDLCDISQRYEDLTGEALAEYKFGPLLPLHLRS